MEKKPTLSSYVYENLKEEILSGKIKQGGQLPSLRALCDQYQVSIRTVMDVLNRLKDEGLVDVQPRKVATVCYRNGDASSDDEIAAVLARRDELRDVYQTRTLIFAPLLAFCAQDCQFESLPHYRQALKAEQGGPSAGGWRTVWSLFCEVLDNNENPMFREVFTLLGRHTWVNFFVEVLTEIQGEFTWDPELSVSGIMRMFRNPDAAERRGQFMAMYAQKEKDLQKSLEYLTTRCPNLPEQVKPSFDWNATRGRDYYFMHIARDLVRKIGSGVYPPDTYLPPEAELAKQYGVCVSTVRKALAELATLGFSQTFNVKGTITMLPDPEAVSTSLQGASVQKQYTLLYLQTIQFMSFVIQPAAELAASNMTDADVQDLQFRFDSSKSFLAEIVDAIIPRVRVRPLRVILDELVQLSWWGEYFSYYLVKRYVPDVLRALCRDALACLRSADAEGFAARITECYCWIFHLIRQFAIDDMHIQEARRIRPVDWFLLGKSIEECEAAVEAECRAAARADKKKANPMPAGHSDLPCEGS